MAAYPRKQTVFIFLVSIFVVLGVTYYVHGDYIDAAVYPELLSPENISVIADNDARLPANTDWKKQFLVSTSSGSQSFNVNTSKNSTKSESITATDALGREFLAKYAELKKSGLAADPDAITGVMGQVAAKNVDNLPAPKVYATDSFTLVDNSNTNLKKYSSTVSYIFANFMPRENEAVIAERAFAKGDMNALKAIDAIVQGYTTVLSKLRQTAVPSAVSAYHTELVNGVSIALYNAEAFRHMDTDPVRAFAAISLEMVGMQKMTTAITNLQKYFVSQGIPF